MTYTLQGTVEEFLREVFIQKIPLTTRGEFSVEVREGSPNGAGPAVSERLHILDRLAQRNQTLPVLSSETLSRESLYDDRL